MAITLEPLVCSACGAAIPLGMGKSARCPYCAHETPIPETHRTAQRAAIEFGANRDLAIRLYGRVGKPPGRFALAIQNRALGAAPGLASFVEIALTLSLGILPIGIFVILFVAWLMGYPVALLVRGALWIAGHHNVGAIPSGPIMILTSFIVAFGWGIPFIRFTREREIAPVRAAIHASLAARLPDRAGGTSCCRVCGAALDVPSGALGVPCSYCKSDNLVALPAAWVASVRSREFEHFLNIDTALEAFRLASERAKERTWRLAFWYVLLFPVIGFFAVLLNGYVSY